MTILTRKSGGERCLLMGNEAIARGALEAGVTVAAGYPGTPSSEIIENLARAAAERKLYVEWSVNEKVALEVAAAASFAGLRALCVMKQNGVNVASDFLLHLAISGVRGGLVLVPCDDPGALSSANEGESRHFARLMEVPLLEPGDFQEAKDMVRWAFELSEEIESVVMLRSVTRLSHASGSVVLGGLPDVEASARFDHSASSPGGRGGPVITLPVAARHRGQQLRLEKAVANFEQSPFNTYAGPEKPELLVITSSACHLYSREAIHMLGLDRRVGLLKLGTTWPLPPRLVGRHLRAAERILVVEEVIPFLEENVKVLAAELAAEIGAKRFFGKRDGTLPAVGEMSPDLVAGALARILDLPGPAAEAGPYMRQAREAVGQGAPGRELAFCAGCPHRASFWSIHRVLQLDGRQGFVCGDIGCYSLAMLPTGFGVLKTLHAMGSGTGLACGFGKLAPFGMDQPVVAVCGDSTFFHAVLPALVNAAHHRADFTLVVLDNSGTAMTGFQPHPGLPSDASGRPAPAVDIAGICRSLGAEVSRADPFDLEATQGMLQNLIEKKGLNILILKQSCALSPEKKAHRKFEMTVAADACIGQDCGCNRLCTRVFKCPGLIWDTNREAARIDEVICTGCGVCAGICPAAAIRGRETG